MLISEILIGVLRLAKGNDGVRSILHNDVLIYFLIFAAFSLGVYVSILLFSFVP